MTEGLIETIERIIEFLVGLGFVVPLVIFLLVRLLSGKLSPEQQQQQRQEQEQRQRQREEQWQGQPVDPQEAPTTSPIPGFPFGGPAWMEMNQPMVEPVPAPAPVQPAPPSQWGRAFERDITPQPSEWGTGFDRPDDEEDETLRWGSAFESDAQGEPIRWTSTFDDQAKNTYGFEGATWGGTFPPRSSEPVIQYD